MPLTSFACPVPESATHSSMPFSLVLVKESRLPSGEKLTPPIRAPAGTLTFFSAPPATDLSVMPKTPPVRCCRPFVLGLMRAPAMRWMGCARSAMVGRLRRSSSAIVWRSGAMTTLGVGAASIMSTITLGGVR